MEEIKKELEKKKNKLLNELIILAGKIAIRTFVYRRKDILVIKMESKFEVLNAEYDKVKGIIDQLDQSQPVEPSNDIKQAYKHLSILLTKEIERKTETLDVQENEMFARLRVSELEFAHSQLKSSLWTFESQKYL